MPAAPLLPGDCNVLPCSLAYGEGLIVAWQKAYPTVVGVLSCPQNHDWTVNVAGSGCWSGKSAELPSDRTRATLSVPGVGPQTQVCLVARRSNGYACQLEPR